MAKPDPALLDPARYPFVASVQTRYGDLDPNGHINNVAIASMLEDGRVRLYEALGLGSAAPGLATMVVSLGTEFIGQAFCPQSIEVHGAVSRIGGASYTVAQLMRQEGRTVAYASSVCVCVADDQAVPLPEPLRQALQAFDLTG